MGMFDGIGEKIGSVFDFGGDDGQQDQMKTPQEQGGFLDWWGLSDAGAIDGNPGAAKPADTGDEDKPGMMQTMGQTFLRGKLSGWFDGPEIGDVDLISVTGEGSGWFPQISLTAAGKKWAMIGAAAVAVFFLTRGR